MKDLVGPYRIRALLGHGGMGTVYLGIHDHLGREVAIKALAPELTRHPEFRERFFAEARVQARLQHTNIVTIYDLIEDEGSFFIVMERVSGPTLEAYLSQRDGDGWSLDRSLHLFSQILAGLDYAHSKGVIHRDVKPSNVLVAEGDLAKLTDFGIALLIGDKRLTASRSTIGTPTYMSPEQILRPRSVDHRTDIYSAAVVLFEMLTGRPPFDAETEYEIKKLQIETVAPDARKLNPGLPWNLAEALATALHKDPEKRFPSAGAFLRALQLKQTIELSFLSAPLNDPVRSPVQMEATDRPPASAHPQWAWRYFSAVGAILLLLGFLVVAYVLFNQRTGSQQADLPSSVVPMPTLRIAPSPAPSMSTAAVEEPPKNSQVSLRSEVDRRVPHSPVGKSAPQTLEQSDLSALKAGLQIRIAGVRRRIAARDFIVARQELAALHAILASRSRGLESEKNSVRLLDEVLTNAFGDQQEISQGNKETPTSVQKATSLQEGPAVQMGREPSVTVPREARRMKIGSIEVPASVAAGERISAVVHAILTPPADQAVAIDIRATLMRNLDPIGSPIKQRITLPAGSGFKILIPIRIPKQAVGDHYLDIEISDVAREFHSLGRIGFTVQ